MSNDYSEQFKQLRDRARAYDDGDLISAIVNTQFMYQRASDAFDNGLEDELDVLRAEAKRRVDGGAYNVTLAMLAEGGTPLSVSSMFLSDECLTMAIDDAQSIVDGKGFGAEAKTRCAGELPILLAEAEGRCSAFVGTGPSRPQGANATAVLKLIKDAQRPRVAG